MDLVAGKEMDQVILGSTGKGVDHQAAGFTVEAMDGEDLVAVGLEGFLDGDGAGFLLRMPVLLFRAALADHAGGLVDDEDGGIGMDHLDVGGLGERFGGLGEELDFFGLAQAAGFIEAEDAIDADAAGADQGAGGGPA